MKAVSDSICNFMAPSTCHSTSIINSTRISPRPSWELRSTWQHNCWVEATADLLSSTPMPVRQELLLATSKLANKLLEWARKTFSPTSESSRYQRWSEEESSISPSLLLLPVSRDDGKSFFLPAGSVRRRSVSVLLVHNSFSLSDNLYQYHPTSSIFHSHLKLFERELKLPLTLLRRIFCSPVQSSMCEYLICSKIN